jgi:hypothetical protein
LLAEWQAGIIDLVAPSLWRYEAANVLARKAADSAVALLGALLELGLPTVDPDPRLLVDAVAIATRLPAITVYDAAYHALALRVRGVFLTGSTFAHGYTPSSTRRALPISPAGQGGSSAASRIPLDNREGRP